MDFDVIPFEDIKGDWKKLGSGSFGNVYKGSYLGVDVAIKEVLPSTDYDVSKYFLRESAIVKEARHPNVVLCLGFSRSPLADGRIFIISEYIENGNLRQYIYDKSKPFAWRLRLSFMIDMARALAYLHARKCIHRDMKGENLLVTSNGRLKVTDFGFARLAARNEEESKRLTFCGTESYMSPEILLGEEFDLPTDVFSLGVIFCEIIARRLADDHIFKRGPPFFGIKESQVYELASPGCPSELITLALECCATNPSERPTMVDILARLKAIELEVLARPTLAEEEQHVGSIKFLSSPKRPSAAPRIPAFGMGVGRESKVGKDDESNVTEEQVGGSDEELESAVRALERVHIGGQETTPQRANGQKNVNESQPSGGSKVLKPLIEKDISFAAATELSGFSEPSSRPPLEISEPTSALHHRFTLIKPGKKLSSLSSTTNGTEPASSNKGIPPSASWSPFDSFFPSGNPVGAFDTKCDLCNKRLGQKLECDDCGLRAHLECGEMAPMDCGLRTLQPSATTPGQPGPGIPSANPQQGLHTTINPQSAMTSATYPTANTLSSVDPSFVDAAGGSGFSDSSDTDTSYKTVLAQRMADDQQDPTASPSTSIPPDNDITGSVSLEGSRIIGHGGFGDLFLGIHKDHGKVALKKPRRLVDAALIRRFLREVDLWCSVSHPHILPCLGMCKAGLDVYIVSPFIENGDLISCMARGRVLDNSKLLFEVAEALTHLHHRGIVHGDVKAQNILLSGDGSALLCDFGLAKAFDTTVTSTESKGAGSARWMAPELCLGEGRSMASDVYSLGITIAEVLSGHAPFLDISDNLAVMFHIVYHDGRPPKEPLSSPEGKSYATLWETAEKCWVKEAKARPHMAQVLGMLFPLTRGGV